MNEDHPAVHNLMANLSFNLTQLKDLEYICELARGARPGAALWYERIDWYRGQFLNRIEELEAQLSIGATPGPIPPELTRPTSQFQQRRQQ